MTYSFAYQYCPYYDGQGFDQTITDTNKHLFGVFDSMGVSEESRQAATRAKEIFRSTMSTSTDRLKELKDAAYALVNEGHTWEQPCGTTATVIQVQGNEIHFVHIGDSRLYIFNSGQIKQITEDEGYENILTNYVGKYGEGLAQFGTITGWDKLMLCTDGITGDREPDIMSKDYIRFVLERSDTPHIAAVELLRASTKEDDKSIIVLFNGEKN